MSRLYRLDTDALHDPKVQLLSGPAFKRAFYDALRGECNAFSPHIRIGGERPSGPAWAALRAEIFERDDYTCQYCGERGGKLECDHVLPVSRGGSSEPENLAAACFDCNRSKRDKTLDEWKPQ